MIWVPNGVQLQQGGRILRPSAWYGHRCPVNPGSTVQALRQLLCASSVNRIPSTVAGNRPPLKLAILLPKTVPICKGMASYLDNNVAWMLLDACSCFQDVPPEARQVHAGTLRLLHEAAPHMQQLIQLQYGLGARALPSCFAACRGKTCRLR